MRRPVFARLFPERAGRPLPIPGRSGIGRVAVVAVILAYAAMAATLVDIGIADNGDFSRSMQWFIEKPSALPSNWPSDEQTWRLRFGTYWIDLWDMRPAGPTFGAIESPSSAQLLNMAGIWANRLAGSEAYSLRVASVPVRIAEILAFATILILLMQRTGSPAIAALAGTGLAIVLLDTGYKAFLNSFYEDRASLLFLTILVPVTVIAFEPGSGRWGRVPFAAALLLLALSKAQLSLTPAVLLGALALHSGASRFLWRRRDPKPPARRLAVIAVLFLLPQAAAFAGTAGYQFGKVNAYHSLFLGALAFSADPGRHLDGFPPGAVRCIGVNAFERGSCFEELAPHSSHAKAALVYLREPAALLRALSFSAASMHDIALETYGRRNLEGIPGPAVEPTLWSWVKQLLPAGGWHFAMLAAFSLLFVLLSRVPRLASFALAGQFLTAISLSQTAIAVLGDGTAEIRKHLLVANLSFDLALMLAVVLCLACLPSLRRRSLRSSLPP